ncbi:MAG: hypothetical protein RJA81_637 [Planctomycetota bacterium]|jgi:Ser/Thr protein kinase RdoA (MazF antagonist)
MNQNRLDWSRILVRIHPDDLPLDQPQIFEGKGGWSGAVFWQWPAKSGSRLLKIWPYDGPTEDQHISRHRRLDCLRGWRIPLAIPIPDLSGNTLRRWHDGRFAELIPWIPGQPISTIRSEKHVSLVADQLALLHEKWRLSSSFTRQRSRAITSRLQQLRMIRKNNPCEPLQKTLEKCCHHGTSAFIKLQMIIQNARLLIDTAIEELEPFENCGFRSQAILRDARPDQFFFDKGNPSGVIDFGAVGTDAISVDLARLTGDWFPDSSHYVSYFLSSYEKKYRLEAVEQDSIKPLALSGAILGGLAWIDLHFVKKRTYGRDQEFTEALDRALLRINTFLENDF